MNSSKKFYTGLTPNGLSKRKKEIQTEREIAYLKKVLNKKQKILDVACGYGRLTIPLAKQHYQIEGVDVTPLLIEEAKKIARKKKVGVKFKVGDMKSLPYKNESFDVIICVWSAFLEIVKKPEQIKTINEMIRVLKKEGFALIDLPIPIKITKDIKNKKEDTEIKKTKNENVVLVKISGFEMLSYRHDEKTLRELMEKANIKNFKIFKAKFGGRDRLFLQFWKT